MLHIAFPTVLATCAQWIVAASCIEGLESDAFTKICEDIRGTSGKFQRPLQLKVALTVRIEEQAMTGRRRRGFQDKFGRHEISSCIM